jgi:putative membrane protein
MGIPSEARPAAALRDYLPEERTFLARIRTGISLMGFGFVVARFGILGNTSYIPQQLPAAQPHERSVWLGAALIAIGAIVNLFSARRFMRLVGELNRDRFADRSLQAGRDRGLFPGTARHRHHDLTLFLTQPLHALHVTFAGLATGM